MDEVRAVDNVTITVRRLSYDPPNLGQGQYADAQQTMGDRLHALRMARGLSMAEVVKATKVPATTISYYERNRTEPGVRNAVALARFYGVTVEWLLDGEETDG